MGHLIITGATGMLGSRLMIDALANRMPIVVLVRSKGSENGHNRIEGILQQWEDKSQRALPRPVVISVDLHKPDLAMTELDRKWLRSNCDSVLHSAASVSFYAAAKNSPDTISQGAGEYQEDEYQEEPYRTNVIGTQNLLSMCRDVAIQKFHHISTAYVCGHRGGLVLENEASENAPFGNDYERSKAKAEQLVRSANFFETTTILRPSIIVGDSETGEASAFHGIYTALQLGYLYLLAKLHEGWQLDMPTIRQVVEDNFIRRLGLTGEEQKNFVPLDWVSSAILKIVDGVEYHGRVFHLTHSQGVSINEFKEAMIAAVMESVDQMKQRKASVPLSLLDSDGFRGYMDVYRAYFRSDPEFDRSNTMAATSASTCPALDHPTMVRMWRHAIAADFTPHRTGMATRDFELAARLDGLPEPSQPGRDLFVDITGPGGGAWLVRFGNQVFGDGHVPQNDDWSNDWNSNSAKSKNSHLGGVESRQLQPIASIRASRDSLAPKIYAQAATLLTLAERAFTIDQALCDGRLAILAGNSASIADVSSLLQALLVWISSQRNAPTRMAPPAAKN